MKGGGRRKTRVTVEKHPLEFGPGENVDVSIMKADGRTSAFGVNYRTLVDGVWRDVIRYDTAHGRVHVHRFWRERAVEGVGDAHGTGLEYAAKAAYDNVRENWRGYRKRLLRKLERGRRGGRA